MSESVLRHDRGSVRWLTLNRPRSANAIDTDLANGLAAALRDAAADPAVAAVVLTGAGDRVFCAGVDIRNSDTAEQRRQNLRTCFWSVLDFPKPLVAAINGVASGGGCMLALLADARLNAETADFVLPEIDIGIPSYPALAILGLLVGHAMAADLVLSGRRFGAAEATRWGLTVAVPAGSLVDLANTHATMLAMKPAETYRQCKMWINRRMRAAIEIATQEGTQQEGRA